MRAGPGPGSDLRKLWVGTRVFLARERDRDQGPACARARLGPGSGLRESAIGTRVRLVQDL
eukprot:2629588-Alexandrium_andersonii.AAC.1